MSSVSGNLGIFGLFNLFKWEMLCHIITLHHLEMQYVREPCALSVHSWIPVNLHPHTFILSLGLLLSFAYVLPTHWTCVFFTQGKEAIACFLTRFFRLKLPSYCCIMQLWKSVISHNEYTDNFKVFHQWQWLEPWCPDFFHCWCTTVFRKGQYCKFQHFWVGQEQTFEF